ncbi:family 16 glycosylhydrolase [Methylobacterium sp. J-076]|uniref:glycoside hydrolase family 16 protein n=1 Tax=Methylobacterium sp. J-076 TaxID=2836655 RepID=UPI001FBAE204|nr:glycoside hydrolase family 16 protein [Methylobacterium sp. J-076]MCJ2011950.1 glycoside hydrolase family 16 protein [Methylobacterium sp. J-076]
MKTFAFATLAALAVAGGAYRLAGGGAALNPVALAADEGAAGPSTEGMKLVFEDTFDGTELDLAKWYPGPKPDGGQWGGAHFVGANEVGFAKVYIVKDGMLTLRAHHDPAYKDPEKWGRTWYSGQVSSAFPNKRISAAIRTGYIETRAKFPKNKGSWPGFWMISADTGTPGAKDPGGTEADVFEFYGDAPGKFSSNVIDWPGASGRKPAGQQLVWTETGADLTAGFHTYGARLTQKEMIVYFDHKEVKRLTLPRPDTTGPFIVLLDNAIHTDSGVDVPPSGYADAVFDYVRVWSD